MCCWIPLQPFDDSAAVPTVPTVRPFAPSVNEYSLTLPRSGEGK